MAETNVKAAAAGKRAVRPRDAATLIVYRRDPDAIRLLMGRRSMGHSFMPGALVFPGGRIERCDRTAPSADELAPEVADRLCTMTRFSQTAARALALAAIRETFEETGYLIGFAGTGGGRKSHPSWAAFLSHGVQPSLSGMRFVARAITPPIMPKRFDTRFFLVPADAIAKQVPVPDKELESPSWVTFDEARAQANVQRITRVILDEVEPRLATGDLPVSAHASFRRIGGGDFTPTMI